MGTNDDSENRMHLIHNKECVHIALSHIRHRGEARIMLNYPYDSSVNALVTSNCIKTSFQKYGDIIKK